MNGYISLGTYDDVHKKIDYTVYAPKNLQQYMKTYNSSLFSQVLDEEKQIEDVIGTTNDLNSRYGFRYDSNFPIKRMESTGVPNSLIDFASNLDLNKPCEKEGFQYASKPATLQDIPSSNVLKGKCSVDGKGCGKNSQLADVMNPAFNLREVAKQSVLLEDHLFNPEKRCKDCISKHALTIEGFLEEAVTLDNNYEYQDTIQELLREFRVLSQNIYDTINADIDLRDDRWVKIAQKLRQFRKPICQKYASNV